MTKYQYSKLIMEKCLRRSFYDAVLKLYETTQGTRIISVSLEGNLTLVVNKDENFMIKLNEIAQRADDREDQHRYKDVPNLKTEAFDQYGMKKEDNASEHFTQLNIPQHVAQVLPAGQDEVSGGYPLYKSNVKENKDSSNSNGIENLKSSVHFEVFKGNKMTDIMDVKTNNNNNNELSNKLESDSYDKSSDTETESEEEGDPDTSSTPSIQQTHHLAQVQNNNALSVMSYDEKSVHGFQNAGDEICFTHENQFVDYSKRKYDCKDQDHFEQSGGRKSPHKKRKLTLDDVEESVAKLDDRDKLTVASVSGLDEANSNTGGLQLLPHTATGPMIAEEEDNQNSSISESQLAQLAMMQMREQQSMLRPHELAEELARQQQWQMVASYQRSIMEKSYLQHQMHQYQRDTERLRWEYAAQQVRDYPSQSSDEMDKLYNKPSSNSMGATASANQTQGSGPADVASSVLASGSGLLVEDSKKSSRDGASANMDAMSSVMNMDSLSASQFRMFSDDPNISQVEGNDYEEGELRPSEVHNCPLCETKFTTMDALLRHMEKHRVAFERSCSVCQLGTLTGHMLILHMEASHGLDSSFPLPSSSSLPPNTSIPLAPSSMDSIANTSTAMPSAPPTPDYSQFFPPSTTDFTGVADPPPNPKISQQTHPLSKQLALSKIDASNMSLSSDLMTPKSDLLPVSYSYSTTSTPSTSAAVDTNAASTSSLSSPLLSSAIKAEDSVNSLSPQFYPLIECQVCREKFALSEALDRHVEANHDVAVSYSCKLCTQTFDKHVDLSKHLSKHELSSSTNLKCSHCLKSFKSVKQLRLHYVATHSCYHFCEYCRAGFPDATSLSLHENMHMQDPEKLTFRCDICNKAFYTQSQCSAHKRTHKEEKAHVCELCGSAFFKRGDLTKHMRTVHMPSRLFSCKFCGKRGTRMDNMRSHVKSHHKNMSKDQIINMIEVIE